MVILNPEVTTRGLGITSSPFLYHLVIRFTPLAPHMNEILVPTRLSKLSAGLEVMLRLALAVGGGSEGTSWNYSISNIPRTVMLA